MRSLKILFLIQIIVLLSCLASPANASLLGKSCTQVGQTKMDDDQVNIIACLKTSSTDAALIWKGQTSSVGDTGSFCGVAMARGYAYTGTWSFSNVIKCNGQDIAIAGTGGSTGGMNCPSGYTSVPLSVATPWSSDYNYFTCVKQ